MCSLIEIKKNSLYNNNYTKNNNKHYYHSNQLVTDNLLFIVKSRTQLSLPQEAKTSSLNCNCGCGFHCSLRTVAE